MQTRSTSKTIRLHESSKAAAAAVNMDPNLWGTLPRELVVKVYTSSEIKEFYQLREVCKGWNQEACSRRCFTDPIPKPYFVVTKHNREEDTHIEIIGYNIAAGTWMSRLLKARGITVPTVLSYHRLDPIGDIVEPFTVEGILFGKGCFHPFLIGECVRTPLQVFLFDIQVHHTILDFMTFGPFGSPTTPGMRVLPQKDCSAIGMMVDTSTKPHGVKLIVGTPNASTLILDSKTRVWETHPSHMIRNRPRRCSAYSPKSCISCDDKVYIWADMDEIQVYLVAEDRWSTLDPPPCHPHHLDTCRGLGHWENEVYAVTRTDNLYPTVWKLAGSHASWEEFELMPPNFWDYLAKPVAKIRSPVMRVLNVNHCGEYLLMHMHVIPTQGSGPSRKPPRRHVLFSLANKRWEMVAVPEAEMRPIRF